MDPLDFLTQEELLRFFHCKKTEMSCIEQPRTFLNQLRDHNLVPEDRYKKVIRMKTKQQKEKGLYEVLDWLETERPHCIKLFWSCVFKDHILQCYPVMRLLRNSLLDGSFHFFQDLPEKEETSEECKEEKKKTELKKGNKRKSKSVDEEEEEPGPSTQSSPSKRKKQQKPSYSSPVRKGVKEPIWRWPFYSASLPVTCGDKEGSLHKDKMAKGEDCILSEGRWFTPPSFEEFGGMKSSKNWKKSIRCQDTPLQILIEEGHLKHRRFCSQRSLTSQGEKSGRPGSSSGSVGSAHGCEKRRKSSSHARKSKHDASESDTDFEEEEEEEKEEDEEEEEEEEENNEEQQDKKNEQEAVNNGNVEGQDDVDLPEFRGDTLSVTCGSATGTLQKDRFASGTSGKCIRTASRWLTPVEFAREDPANDSWRKCILCQGAPISDLIQRRVLIPHSLLCQCRLCSKNEKDLKEHENDDHCSVCGLRGSLLCCDRCPRAFHNGCHLPTVDENMLGQEWLCTYCILKGSQDWRYACERSMTQALGSGISNFKLECQYLLLRLYSADEGHIFSSNPCATVPRYSEFIKRPMWLDKVAEKLQNGQYSTVGQFVTDVHLIFTNCATFNRNNEFGQLGARLRGLFEEEFLHVFSVKN